MRKTIVKSDSCHAPHTSVIISGRMKVRKNDGTEAVTDYCYMEGIGRKVENKGQKGLFEIQKREYDLILLDLAMPEYTGLDILCELKKRGVRCKRIVILRPAVRRWRISKTTGKLE